MELDTVKYPDTGKIFVHINSRNITEILQLSRKNNIDNICLNPAFGWEDGTPLEFLKNNDWIKGIDIIGQKCNLTPINYLSKLTYFGGVGTNYTGRLDFKNLSHLEYLTFNWDQKKFQHFEVLTKLHEVRIWRWSDEGMHMMQKLIDLKKIELNYSRKLESLQGIENLKSLKRLDIYSAPNLRDINDLGLIKNSITNLNFEHCPKIEDFSVLESLQNLETFVIQKSAPMQSVQFIKNLKNLRYAYIGTEVLDGNIEILKEKKIEYKKLKKYEEK